MLARDLRPRSSLRSYQNFFIAQIKRCWSTGADKLPGIILALDMGAGKSASVLFALKDLFDEGKIRRALVIAPKNVAASTWPDEIEHVWEELPALTFTVLRVEDDDIRLAQRHDLLTLLGRAAGLSTKDAGKAATAETTEYKMRLRREAAAQDTQIHIINKEGLDWLWSLVGHDWPYDVIVIDEASMLKSGKKRVHRGKGEKKGAPLSRFGIIGKASRATHAVIEMTGTPNPNGLHQLWGLAYPIDGGARLGTSRTAFEKRWFVTDKYSHKIEPTASAEREIMGALSDIMFSLGPEDYPDLPPVFSYPVKVNLAPDVLRSYRRFEREMVAQEWDVEAVNAGVLHNKLLQFANGSLYREDGSAVAIHDEKLRALETIVDETEGEPLLVAYTFKFDLDRIRTRFRKAVVLNETDIRETTRAWNAGKIEMLLAHPASAGHGLNLQFGGHNAVWYGLTSDLELYQQFNKRLHRPGQQKPVFIRHITANGTLDERILPIYLDPKAATQQRVLDAVRVKIRQ